MKSVEPGLKRFAGAHAKQSKCVQVMYINFRVRIAFAQTDSLCSITKRVSVSVVSACSSSTSSASTRAPKTWDSYTE